MKTATRIALGLGFFMGLGLAIAAPDVDPWVAITNQQVFMRPARFEQEARFAMVDAGAIATNTLTATTFQVTSSEKIAVVDAGVLLVNGQAQVLGPIRADTATLTIATIDAGQILSNGALQVLGSSTLAGVTGTTSNFTTSANTPFATVAGIDAGSVAAQQFANISIVGTPGSGTGITVGYAAALRHWTTKVTVINTALAAAGTSDVTLLTTPANSRIIRVVADVTTQFTGGALSAVTITCGKTAGGNEYLLSGNVFAAAIVLGDAQAEVGAGLLTATWADFGTASSGTNGAITVQCRFTCTNANCSAATGGSATFYIEGETY